MKTVFINDLGELVISIGENNLGKELATKDDVEFGVCCGVDILEVNKVYRVKEGYLMIVYDELTSDVDYLMVKIKSPEREV